MADGQAVFKIVRRTVRSVARLLAYCLFLGVMSAATAVVLGWSPAIVQTTRLYEVNAYLVVDDVFAFAEPAAAAVVADEGPLLISEIDRGGPFTRGDDPELDALWEQCEAGFGQACDDLFTRSPLGSAYEEFGLTCGGREDVFDCRADLDGVLDPYVVDGWPPPQPAP